MPRTRVTTDGGRFQRHTLFEHATELVRAAIAEEKNKEWAGYDARWGDAGELVNFSERLPLVLRMRQTFLRRCVPILGEYDTQMRPCAERQLKRSEAGELEALNQARKQPTKLWKAAELTAGNM
jgi:hypothetical protein